MRKILPIALLSCLVAQPIHAEDGSGFSGDVAFTTDYVFRGVSQTLEDPAIQAGLSWAHHSGFFVGAWGSNVDFVPSGEPDDGADIELDLYVGYGMQLNDEWSAEVRVLRYIYPGTVQGVNYNYNELEVAATWNDQISFLVAYSNDIFATNQDGTYFNVSGSWGLPSDFSLNAGIGYSFLSRNVGEDYMDYVVGVSRDFGSVGVSLDYFGTDSNGRDNYGETADGRLVLTAGLSF